MGIYIIRFKENAIIHSLKVCDKITADFIISQLEKSQTAYILIKSINNENITINNLLDFNL